MNCVQWCIFVSEKFIILICNIRTIHSCLIYLHTNGIMTCLVISIIFFYPQNDQEKFDLCLSICLLYVPQSWNLPAVLSIQVCRYSVFIWNTYPFGQDDKICTFLSFLFPVGCTVMYNSFIHCIIFVCVMNCSLFLLLKLKCFANVCACAFTFRKLAVQLKKFMLIVQWVLLFHLNIITMVTSEQRRMILHLTCSRKILT